MKNLKAALPIFQGFYNTIFQADEDVMIDEGKTHDCYEWDYAGYKVEVSKACVNAIEAKLIDLGFGVSIEYNYIYSPREYNFANDAILAKYQLKAGCIGKIKAYLIDNRESLVTYLVENFKSRSGFSSYYPYNVDEWMKFVTLKSFRHDEIYLEHILNFILLNEDYDYMQLYYDSIDYNGINIDCTLKDVEIEPIYDFWGDLIEPEIIEVYVFNPNQLVLQLV